MPATSVQIDPSDVAIVESLGPRLKALIGAAEAAMPSLLRLTEANYPGADALVWQMNDGLAVHPASDGSVTAIQRALASMTAGAGDQAAFDYHRLVVRMGMTLRDACHQLMECCDLPEHDLNRVAALRCYAASRP
jgi:hypothetical protein